MQATASFMEISRRVMEIFEGVGMFCVELLVTKEGAVYVNDAAPQSHNSAHYTIEGTTTNQFGGSACCSNIMSL